MAHFLLHLTYPKHRSWQTHSLLFTGGLLTLLYVLVLVGDQIWDGVGNIDWVILRLLTIGLILGVTSHLFLDAINPSGIHLYPGFKIRFVPKTPFFATGGPWETLIFYLCMGISVIAFADIVANGLWGLSLLDTFNVLIGK